MKTFVYGAGPNGRRFVQTFGKAIPLTAYVDQDPNKKGQMLDGLPVITPDDLIQENPDDCVVLVASQAWQAITERLKRMGFEPGTHVFNALALLGSHPVTPRWDEDAAFQALLQTARPHTLLDDRRLYMLYQYALQAQTLDGDWAETGVYRGGSAYILAALANGKTCFFFDTFSGMPDVVTDVDSHAPGDFSDTALAEVEALLAEFEHCVLIPGIFPESAGDLDRTFGLVHVDFDIYNSVLAACHFFWPRLVPGGIMLFDDYGFDSCLGVREAVRSFFGAEHPGVYLPTGQLVMTKPNQS